MLKFIFICIALCSSVNAIAEENAKPNDALAGSIGGKAWTYVAGKLQDDSDPDSTLFQLFPSAAMDVVQDPTVLLSIPKKIGKFQVGPDAQVTLVTAEKKNTAATKGTVTITTSTKTSIEGTIDCFADNDNHLKGVFSIKILPAKDGSK